VPFDHFERRARFRGVPKQLDDKSVCLFLLTLGKKPLVFLYKQEWLLNPRTSITIPPPPRRSPPLSCGNPVASMGVVVLMLATCPSFPLLPPCCAAVAAGCRAAAATALGSSSVVTSSATGCCWLCCCLSGVTLARGVGLRWRHFLLGRRSHRADLHNPIDLCEGALPLGHVFVEASTTRGHGEFCFWRDADAATVACQKSGIYPTFDSAARLG
jgi:hypothetical protein